MTRSHLRAAALPFLLVGATLSACSRAPLALPAPRPIPEVPASMSDSAPLPPPTPMKASFASHRRTPPATAPASTAVLGEAAYDLPVEANLRVQMELDFLVNERHAVVGRWLERAEPYREFVEGVFTFYGLPRDLYHLAMVESGYQPTVRSHAGAVGMWQFMPATGRGMGLRIDELVDERMDPVRSTHAAARHLRQLYNAFNGDWPLAAAAYNAGTGRISRGIARYGARTFWELAERGDLAQETRRYVPRLYAVTIIAKDPRRFGYAPPVGEGRAFAYDSLHVDVMTPLGELARIGGVAADELAALNPHLRQAAAPAQYWVWVPAGKGAAMREAFAASDFRRRGGYDLYTLRAGDDLASLAAATGLTVDQIRSLNLSTNLDRLGRGDRIRLWADAVRALESRSGVRMATREEREPAAARQAPRLLGVPVSDAPARVAEHVVREGDTLWSIARAYESSVEAIRGANGMNPDSVLQAGQTLRVPRTGATR